jgi:hypothetical protein
MHFIGQAQIVRILNLKNNICVYLRKSVSYIIGGDVRFEKHEGEDTNEG